MFCYGEKGSGKTSTLQLLDHLSGAKEKKLYKLSRLSAFVKEKLFTSSNGIPVITDEYGRNMDEKQRLEIEDMMRNAYDGGRTPKGQQDQTLKDYDILTPWAVAGERKFNDPAIDDRCIVVNFRNDVDTDAEMKKAFYKLNSIDLRGFFTRYIPFILSQDLEKYFRIAERIMKTWTISNRPNHNLKILLVGLMLYKKFGRRCGFPVAQISVRKVIDALIEEVAGGNGGKTRRNIDDFVEYLSILAARGN